VSHQNNEFEIRHLFILLTYIEICECEIKVIG